MTLLLRIDCSCRNTETDSQQSVCTTNQGIPFHLDTEIEPAEHGSTAL